MNQTLQPVKPSEMAWDRRVQQIGSTVLSRWQGLSPAEKQRLVVASSIALAVVVFLFWWAIKPTWKVLYSGLSSEDSRQIASLLTAASIQYDVSPDGGSLMVPAQVLDKARLATATKASGKSGRLGFELFDKPNWAGSDFDEKVNYQRALEGELEHTIDTLSSVQSSRVHLVLPHDALFADQQREAKASVVIRLKGRSLSDSEADSIRGLVASGVDGLSPDHVVLVDADGHHPLGSKTRPSDLNAAYEEVLAEHIVQTLEPVAGDGNVRATVTVDYDSAASDEVDEKYDPAAVVTLSMQRSEEASGDQPSTGGVPGTATNAPNQQPPLFPSKQSGAQTSKQESGTYGASKKTVHLVQGPGRLRRITAAVLVNDRLVLPASKKDSGHQQAWTGDEMKQFTSLVQAAVGYDASRGDQVVVQNLRFQTNASESKGTIQHLLQSSGGLEPILKYGTILILTAVLLVTIGRPLLAQHAKTSVASTVDTSTPMLDVESPEPPPLPISAPQLLFDQVAEHIQRDPAQSARIVQTWLRSE